jgi:hypothetical protein
MDKTDPSPGIGDQVVLKAWTLRDDRTQSHLTLHCTDRCSWTNGRSIENLQGGLGQIGNNLYALWSKHIVCNFEKVDDNKIARRKFDHWIYWRISRSPW